MLTSELYSSSEMHAANDRHVNLFPEKADCIFCTIIMTIEGLLKSGMLIQMSMDHPL